MKNEDKMILVVVIILAFVLGFSLEYKLMEDRIENGLRNCELIGGYISGYDINNIGCVVWDEPIPRGDRWTNIDYLEGIKESEGEK